jgi:1,4-dihydroxy-2-naphthoyl-CoA synthase
MALRTIDIGTTDLLAHINADVGAVLLTGAGIAFCAGGERTPQFVGR